MDRSRLQSAIAALCLPAAAALGLAACSSGTPAASTSTTAPPTTSTSTSTSQPATASATPPPKPFLLTLGKPAELGSTVPSNGDVNPYGIAVVPVPTGALVAGDVLVSNFNDKGNVQGTGTTIVELAPSGRLTQFARVAGLPAGDRCPGGIGLGTGLAILPGGWVVVGSVPAAGPSGAPAPANPNGCLVVLDSSGRVVETWSDPEINGPWDLAVAVHGNRAAIFLSNVLTRPASLTNVPKTGDCTVTRIDVALGSGVPRMTGATTIGAGFLWEVNRPTFVLGPTGLALGHDGTLYVAETLGNEVSAIADAATRSTPVSQSASTIASGGFLDAPLGMVTAPDGDLLVTNGDDGNVVEITPQGKQVAERTLAEDGAGDLFGITLTAKGDGIVFVNDGANAVETAVAGAPASGGG